MSTPAELLPCPFCGTHAASDYRDLVKTCYCGNGDCPANQLIACSVKDWNTRPPQAPPKDAEPVGVPPNHDLVAPASRYSIEPHGNGYALYFGRDNNHHGLNLAQITEALPATLDSIWRAMNQAITHAPDTSAERRDAERLLLDDFVAEIRRIRLLRVRDCPNVGAYVLDECQVPLLDRYDAIARERAGQNNQGEK